MFRNVATKIAHNSTIPALAGNKDLRPLQDLIAAEKTVLSSLQKLSADFGKASEALRAWGVGEGDDLGDTLSASNNLLNHFTAALLQYASHGHAMRDQLKAIRTREEALDDLKRRRKSVASSADAAERKLSKMSPEHKNLPMQTETLNKLREEIRSLDSEIMVEEAALGDFKRVTTRSWVGLKFGGLLEMSEKGTIVGEYGKLVVAEIPESVTQPGLPRNPYYGHAKTEAYIAEAARCVNEISLSSAPTTSPRQQNPQDLNNRPPLGPNGGDPWAPRQSNDLPPPPGAAPNFLSTPQGLGTGRFITTPDLAPQQSSQVSAYPEIEAYQPPRGYVDDFGVGRSPGAGPIDQPTSGGGRFATFPVKTRAPGGQSYSLRDEPPSLNSRQDSEPSFSSSIAEALGKPPRQDTSEFYAPTLQRADTSPFAPPTTGGGGVGGGGDLGDTLPDSLPDPWENAERSRFSSHEEDDTSLAYMTEPTEEQHARHTARHEVVSRHVRFGSVEDVDEEMEKRNHWGAGNGGQLPPPIHSEEVSQPTTPSHEMNSDNRAQSSHRIPPPTFDPHEEERALNAAAAREISREMDALMYNPPIQPGQSTNQSDQGSLRDNSPDRGRPPSYGAISPGSEITPRARSFEKSPSRQGQDARAPLSPLGSPTGQRGSSGDGSPRVDTNFTAQAQAQAQVFPDEDGVANNSTSPARAYAQQNSNSNQSTSPYQQRPSFDTPVPPSPVSYSGKLNSPLPQTPGGGPEEEGSGQYGSDQQSPLQAQSQAQSPQQQQAQPLQGQPQQQQQQQRSIASPLSSNSNASTSPYRTPPEYSRSSNLAASSFTNLSVSSAGAAGAGQSGTRTISAAAFKRPPPRVGGGAIGAGGGDGSPIGSEMGTTSPLMLAKKPWLPSSPYPQQRNASVGSGTGGGGGVGMERDRSASNVSAIGGGGGGGNVPVTVQPAGAGGVPGAEDGDGEEYDYISAYARNSQLLDGPRQSGYGDGRFSTDLEGSGLR